MRAGVSSPGALGEPGIAPRFERNAGTNHPLDERKSRRFVLEAGLSKQDYLRSVAALRSSEGQPQASQRPLRIAYRAATNPSSGSLKNGSSTNAWTAGPEPTRLAPLGSKAVESNSEPPAVPASIANFSTSGCQKGSGTGSVSFMSSGNYWRAAGCSNPSTGRPAAALQPWQPVAATRSATEGQEVVADELTAPADEDRRTSD